MSRLVNPIPGTASFLAAEIQMIGSAMCGHLRPFCAAGKFGIYRNLLNRRLNQLGVPLQGSRAKILLRSSKDARNVSPRLRSDNEFHLPTRRSSQLLS
jgi:hypothetical protein